MSSVLYDAPGPRALARNRLYTLLGVLLCAGAVGLVVWRLQVTGQLTAAKWNPFQFAVIQQAVLRGWISTVQAAAVATVLALVLGTLLAAARLSTRRALSRPVTWAVEFLRGPPVLLMMFWFLYASGGTIPVFWCVVLGLTLYNAAIISEILRAGVLSLPKGQREAGLAVGLTPSQVTRLILMPQAVRAMLPALVAQVVVILKDTALGFIVGYEELLRVGGQLGSQFFNLVPTFLVIAVVYVGTNSVVALLAKVLERRMSQTGKVTRTTAKVPEQVGGVGGGVA
ncbi:amino acid ABC transporter permease [Kineococcus sp. NUM-3379]